jgi:hypothetical protein
MGKSGTLIENGEVLKYTVKGKGSEIKLTVYNPNKMKIEYAYVFK